MKKEEAQIIFSKNHRIVIVPKNVQKRITSNDGWPNPGDPSLCIKASMYFYYRHVVCAHVNIYKGIMIRDH